MKKTNLVVMAAIGLLGALWLGAWLEPGWKEDMEPGVAHRYNLAYLGKSIRLSVPEGLVVDGEYIQKVCAGEINYQGAEIPQPFFDLFIPSEVEKVTQYMARKGYRIKPGLYDLQTNMTGEYMISLLEFSSLEVDDGHAPAAD